MSEYTVFNIEGGIGKHILSTAVVAAYKNNNPTKKVVVVCAWPEVFLHNKDVHRVYRLGNVPYFYEDYINGKDTDVFAQEPYRQTSHIGKKKQLIETWCDMIGTKYNGELPKLAMNLREKNYIDPELAAIQKTKPILLFQPFGGPGKDHQADNYSWVRDIHPDVAQHMVNQLKEHYQILHVCYDFHTHLTDVIRYEKVVPKKNLFNLLRFADRNLFVDSSFQHAAAALNKPSTVVWIGTQPQSFGYEMHDNFTPPVEFPNGTIDSYLHDYNFTGAIHECPYDDVAQMFDVDGIINSLLTPPLQNVPEQPSVQEPAPNVKTGKHKKGSK